jgi:hypothetical protein
MNAEDLRKRIKVLQEQRAWIDNAIAILESQLEALELQERTMEKGTEVLEVKPARGGGSYVLQKVKCGKPSCHCAKPGGELHGPYWYLYTKKGGKGSSKYIGKNRPTEP